MKKNLSLDYNKKFQEQLLTEEELDKVKAKSFINLLSDLFLKYENQIELRRKPNMEEQIGIAMDNIEHVFDILSAEDKKKVLHAFIDKIYVNQGKSIKERTIKTIELKFDLNHIDNFNQTA